jgi:hypothetical protein
MERIFGYSLNLIKNARNGAHFWSQNLIKLSEMERISGVKIIKF